MWRSSSSTLNSSRRNSCPHPKFESKRKLFSASCINNHFLSVVTQRSCPHVRLERGLTVNSEPHLSTRLCLHKMECFRVCSAADLSVNLPLHFSTVWVQLNSSIWGSSSPTWRGQSTLYRLRTLVSDLEEVQRPSAKNRAGIFRPPNPSPSSARLLLVILA